MSEARAPTVADYMTRDVVTVEEDDSLENLLRTLQTLRFRHLPVTDDRKLVGLVTERDLLRVSASSLLPHHAEQDRFISEHFCVRDVMTRDVASISSERSLREAGALMLQHRVGCLPVVNTDNELVGILTASDFIRAGVAWLG